MASFGPGPEMQIPGRVAVWEPPRRICFDGGEGVDGLAFEWTVEPRGADRCVVRLVNTGFGQGNEWDAQYDAMVEGWGLFMSNLRLHLEHFGGRRRSRCCPPPWEPAPAMSSGPSSQPHWASRRPQGWASGSKPARLMLPRWPARWWKPVSTGSPCCLMSPRGHRLCGGGIFRRARRCLGVAIPLRVRRSRGRRAGWTPLAGLADRRPR